ncbi:MAG: hypothetical protein C4526_12020 [Nitrospiraceae bacterium]|nr:MAG: hypothetical protein C4526_12020 [Nitrospiraceae bacterium]
MCPFFDHTLTSHKCPVRQWDVRKVPCMRMLGVDPSKAAFKLPAFRLQPMRQ